MGEQQRFGRPPTEVVNVSMRRVRGQWELRITARVQGSDTWDTFDMSDLGVVDLLEVIRVELERRLL